MLQLPSQIFTAPLLIESHAYWAPDRPALIAGDQTLNYGELNRRINRVANALIGLGVRKADRVGILTSNRFEHFELTFGALKAGAVVAPLSLLLNTATTLRLLRDAEVKVVLVEQDSPLLTAAAQAEVPSLLPQGVLVLDRADCEAATPYARLIACGCEAAPAVQVAPEDDCTIIYSSGTTGIPKGIVHSHLGRSMYGVGFAAELAMDRATVSALTTPAYSNGSWMLMLPTLYAGGTLIVMPRFDVAELVRLTLRHGVTHAFLVPTQIEALLAYAQEQRCQLPSLRAVISAGSKLHDQTKRKLAAFTGRGFYEIYGNTEGAGTLLKPEHLPRKLTSVGPPAAGGEIRIVDEHGVEVPRGERGEVVGRNLFMSRGYLNRPDLNEELVWYDPKGRLFVRSGDIGRLDEDGFLYILDRKKDMILSGGINVYACDIEAVLIEHPLVQDCAVVAAPHAKWGETPYAFVEPAPGAQPSGAELKAWVNERLNKHQRVHAVAVVASLPRNALQKVMKTVLREPLWHEGGEPS